MNKNYLPIFALTFLLLSLGLSSAWIVPESHSFIAHKALEKAPGSSVGTVVEENFDDFVACMALTDYSVFFYFNEGFSTIGKVYLSSHNYNACATAIEKADKSNPAQLACAYGICGMGLMDSPSHNGFVPEVIRKTGLVNGIVHASSEECVNKKIETDELTSEGINAIVTKYPVHRDFLMKVFQSDKSIGAIDVGKMMDAFVAEITSNAGSYTVGFRGFTSIPWQIHMVLILAFLLEITMGLFLVRRKNKTNFNRISVILLSLGLLFIILIYVLYFTGNLWKGFQIVNTPVCWVLPTGNYEVYIDQAINNMVNFYNNGVTAIYSIPDPSGLQALSNADNSNTIIFIPVAIILLGLSFLFVWLNFRKPKGKRK